MSEQAPISAREAAGSERQSAWAWWGVLLLKALALAAFATVGSRIMGADGDWRPTFVSLFFLSVLIFWLKKFLYPFKN